MRPRVLLVLCCLVAASCGGEVASVALPDGEAVQAAPAAPPPVDDASDVATATEDVEVLDSAGRAARAAAAAVEAMTNSPAREGLGERAEALRRQAAAMRPAPPADPVHLAIPSLGVASDLLHLDLRADEPEVPEAFDVAGWYEQTVEPGQVGPAVVVGHVGSRHGPGIFHALDRLRPGDTIEVTDAEGTVRTFVVDRGALVDKYDRPPDVFGRGEERPELRLITCGGDFDPAAGHHVSNYVVWAHQLGS